jgi:uncharacterized membrane protein YfcA
LVIFVLEVNSVFIVDLPEIGQFGYMINHMLILMATGLIVGFSCGLLGVGGGFIMVPVQIWVLTLQGIDPTIATRTAFGTSLAVILLTSLSGCYGHSCRDVVLWRQGVLLGLSGLFGAFFGGTIAAHTPGNILKMIFGLVVLSAAARMLFVSMIQPTTKKKEDVLSHVLWGFSVGIISGLTGIGGGVVLIPIMILIFGFKMHEAIGTSTVAIAFNAAGGVISYAINGWSLPGFPAYSIGYIDLEQFVLLASTSVFAAHLGVDAAHRLPANQLRKMFIVLLIYVGLKMLGVFSLLNLPI